MRCGRDDPVNCCGAWRRAWSACMPAIVTWFPVQRRTTEGCRSSAGYTQLLKHGVTGRGANDYPAIFELLVKHNFRGWISIEDGMNGMEENGCQPGVPA